MEASSSAHQICLTPLPKNLIKHIWFMHEDSDPKHTSKCDLAKNKQNKIKIWSGLVNKVLWRDLKAGHSSLKTLQLD